MLQQQAGHGNAGFAGLLCQATFEIDWVIGSPLARLRFNFIVHFGSHYLFDGNHFAPIATYVQTAICLRLQRNGGKLLC